MTSRARGFFRHPLRDSDAPTRGHCNGRRHASLAAGVGANVAIFSVGYAMLAHPLPYPGADRLVMLRPVNPSHGMVFPTVAPANLVDWQARAKSFEAIAGYRRQTVDLTGGDRSERLRGLSVTPEFFRVLGVPLMGETFGPNDPPRRGSKWPHRRASENAAMLRRSSRGRSRRSSADFLKYPHSSQRATRRL